MKKLLGAAIVALAASAANAQFLGSNNTPAALPDATPAGVNSIINVPNAFNVTGIAVTTRIDGNTGPAHTWLGDIIIKITSPANQTFILLNRATATTTSGVGDSSDMAGNYRWVGEDAGQYGLYTPAVALAGGTGNFWTAAAATGAAVVTPGDYRTSAPLTGALTNMVAFFNGTGAQGNWTLNISDNAGGDTGRLVSWTLQLLPEPASMALLGLGAMALIRRRR